MAATSRGHAAKPRAVKHTKGGTVHQRNHRFESFSHRIAKLKIEPIRRGRSTIVDDAELDVAFSYFKDSLVEWRDLNTSAAFTTFARQVAPLCESLPQVLHHNDRILELLVQYIETGDAWSAEPLLSLMAHFAHDLGVKFEKHFERAVKTVSQLAAKHQSFEVIEWSFTCLAWLFKYLSRLLVPDLRPVFDLMAPLLGKEHQKSFVTRFAAEALSFLVRKAGATYHRDKNPLRTILAHISEQLEPLQGSGKDQEFQQGLMTLFADSMRGVQRGLHSSAAAILQEMVLQTYREEYAKFHIAPLEPILVGVITAVMHHSDAENMQPLLDIILFQITSADSDTAFAGLSSRLLFVMCGTRQGSRIEDWKPVLEALDHLLNKLDSSRQMSSDDEQDLLSAIAVVFQSCPLDVAIPHIQILEALTRGAWERLFLPFCNLFASMGSERFQALLLPYFKRFVTQKAHEQVPQLCAVLPQLYRSGSLPTGSVQLSSAWQHGMIQEFETLVRDGQDDESGQISYRCNDFIEASRVLDISPDIKKKIAKFLARALESALQPSNSSRPQTRDFLATGNGLLYLVQESEAQDSEHHQFMSNLWPSLCEVSPIFGRSLLFWQALLSLAGRVETPFSTGQHIEPLKRTLMQCLGSPSHDLRFAALSLLEVIMAKDEKLKSAVATAMMIEQTPLTLENARSISLRIRQLTEAYPTVCSDEWAGEAIPTFCFGLLHVKLAQAWDDACAALKAMCETKEGEVHVSRLAFEWLSESPDDSASISDPNEEIKTSTPYATEFECTNVLQLKLKTLRFQHSSENVEQRLKSMFDFQHFRQPPIVQFSRTQALRVLNLLPHVAEKRSRLLVPVLLNWACNQPVAEASEADTTAHTTSGHIALHWSRKDQKAMLSLFAKFTNPKVLFRSGEVYEALLVLLSNGDVEIQKSALQAILTWKQASIVRYQENLFNLLDDARFREEISVFMDVDEEESHLQGEHRKQLLPVILRLLYGKVINGKTGQEAKRKAVFIALTRFEEAAIRQFLSIAFGPLGGISIHQDAVVNEELINQILMSPRKQLGMLNMLEDMLNTLKTTLTPFTASIVDPLLYCLITASRGLSTTASDQDCTNVDNNNPQLSLLRTIRQRGFHSLNILFESCPEFTWTTYTPIIVQELVNPRLEQFPIETAQSVSGLLRLFAAWSKSPQTAPYLVQYNPDILTKIIDCLDVPSGKDEVKKFVLDDILRSLVSHVHAIDITSVEAKIQRSRIQSDVLQPYANIILGRLGDLLRKSPSKDLLESGVQTVAELAPHLVGSAESRSLLDISTFLLQQPSKRVNAYTKLGLLKIIHEFIPRCDSKDMDELFDTIFDITCSLFSSFQDRTTRSVLCEIIQDLSNHHGDLQNIANLCADLNSFSASRLDEPDFERRSQAFITINENRDTPYTLTQWRPLVYNMLYYIKDNEELSIRVNASMSLRRFIDASLHDEAFKPFLSSALLPGIQRGMRENSELVRVEFLAVLAHLVKLYPDWAPIADLHVLLLGDEEASFFGNVLHIQAHRRLRALRRLAANASQLQGGNICHILIPLLEHFIFNKSEDESAHNLAGEAVRSIAALSEWLEWPQFRSLMKRFIGYLTTKEDMQKTLIKLLAGMMDSLNQAGRAKGYASRSINTLESAIDSDNNMNVDKPVSTLTKTLPQQEKLSSDISSNILPDLNAFLHKKDDSTVSLRVPIAVAVTKVLLVLPTPEIEARLPAVLLDICHILKSRSQEGRDMARNTLAEIAALTGPTYLGFILKALRTALQRGYQLHVLSFTLHHILVKMADQLNPGDIDYCLTHIVDVIMDDTFGVTGQEKDAEEYISKMKEVKSSKSFDSMDIIARSTKPTHLIYLIRPIKSLLLEKLNVKMVLKIDELLRRIGLGILQNPTVMDRDILVFCYELIQEVYKTGADPGETKQENSKNRRYLVNMKGAAKSGVRHSTSSHVYKITRFSLDVLRMVLKKHEQLQTPQNLSGFLPIMGDALVQGQEEVQIAAMRLLTTIIRLPMDALDRDCPVYVTEAVQTIKGAASPNSEIAQVSLKMISAILRDRPNVVIKERDIAQLLKRLVPDLEELDRQGATFGFLKAIMNRKIVITEVYEVMDKVAAMMVTNQTKSSRDLARSNYFHFLMEYPQAKNRFNKQLEFLIRNLRYEYIEGRQSVMEALNLILTKVGDNVLQDVLVMMFLPLLHSMANDDSSNCRTMAGALIKKLFERADSQRLKSFTSDLKGWLEQNEDMGLKRLGIQCWGLYFEVAEYKPKDLAWVLDQLQISVEECVNRRGEDDWELIYYSLMVFSKLCKSSPETTLASNKESFWVTILSCVSYPHAWVKLTTAKLIGLYFSDFARKNGDSGLHTLPLRGSQGLQMTEESMVQLTNACLKNLSIPDVSEELCAQSVRNLAFLSRCLAVNGATWDWQKVDDDDELEDTLIETPEAAANGDDASDNEEWGGCSPPPVEPLVRHSKPKSSSNPPTAIHRLISRLSGLIRRETKIMRISSLYPKTAVMTLLETLSFKLPISSLASSLPHLLMTLHTLTDPATTVPRSTDQTFNDTYKALIDKAHEIMNILQKQLGTQEYLKFMEEVQKSVKQRREERRTKRKVEAVTMPERYGKEKKRRHDVQRVKRKEKSAEHRGQRRGW
ncbi:HEAT repeat protein-like protein [Pleomassaria siparia CBS 279.74]|uniref:HEAT repeat protein-like protein n=1 Tax=Pleomassaria siparia CBS 279.74 TaxID=1314801 RepID=A0A6G1JRF5_9PLEO|nr:HEAT repeat protein-like protein [Pleomassaria siparia CBS 279.74]